MGQMWTLETLRWTWKGRRWESGKNMNFGDSRSELLTGWKNVSVVFAATSLQSCPTLCDPTDSSLPGSPVPGILQARTLEWAAISFSNAWKWKVKVKSLSPVRLLATPWTAAYQAPPSMGFSRQEYWSGGAIAFSGVVFTSIHFFISNADTSIWL